VIPVLVGLIFLGVGAGVYHHNTQSHDSQIILAGLTPDQTVAALFGLGVLLVCVGAARWLMTAAAEEE
jgi:hypothetical protein